MIRFKGCMWFWSKIYGHLWMGCCKKIIFLVKLLENWICQKIKSLLIRWHIFTDNRTNEKQNFYVWDQSSWLELLRCEVLFSKRPLSQLSLNTKTVSTAFMVQEILTFEGKVSDLVLHNNWHHNEDYKVILA